MATLGAHNPTNRIVQRWPLKNSLGSCVRFHYIIPKEKAKILFIGQSKNETELKSQTTTPFSRIAQEMQTAVCISKRRRKYRFTSILLNREARRSAPSGNDFPLKTHWAALCAAAENFKKSEKSLIVEHIYNSARTYFIKNS